MRIIGSPTARVNKNGTEAASEKTMPGNFSKILRHQATNSKHT